MAFDPDLGGKAYVSQYVPGKGRAPDDRRPNVILVMSDEHQAGMMGCAGDPVIQTRNLDTLAERGVMFENCYTNSPLCVPSRASFTSGKYVSGCKVWNNFCMLDANAPSLPRVLNAAGYESFLCGKMHYDYDCRYGFKELWRNLNGDFQTGEGGRRKANDLDSGLGNYPDWKEDFGTADSHYVMRQGQRVTNGTLDFLSKRNADDKPFFLLAGYEAPHYPIVVPQSYYDLYKGRVPVPEVPKHVIDNLPLNYKHMRRVYRSDTVSPDFFTYMNELYYGLTHWMDDEIGKVLTALKQSPFADNTVIMYTSDHGESMGKHGMIWKGTMYEHSARVPLIVSFPQRWKGGQKRKGACSLLDVVQTVTDLAQAKVPSDWNGTPLTGWLDDPKARWKDIAVSEYYAQQIASGLAMIRTGKWKYVYHTAADSEHGPERELYALESDPNEFHNLAADPKHKSLIAELHAMLAKEAGEDPEQTEARARAELARGYNRPARTTQATREPKWQGD